MNILPGKPDEGTVYDQVGGREFFDALVERFYAGIASDVLLRPLYPEDLTESKHHMAGFLSQYWGGGAEHYSEARGHPRLRMRHAPFVITEAERDAWLRHMLAAVRSAGLEPDLETRMVEYFEMAAAHLVNT